MSKSRLTSIKNIALVLALSLCSNFAGIFPASAETLKIEEIKVGIVGKEMSGYGCWPKSAKGRKAFLQVRIAGQWKTKNKVRLYRDDFLCDSANPFVAYYSWRVDELGEFPNPDSRRARDMFVRQYLPKTKKAKAATGDSFLVMIYRSEYDQALDFKDLLDGILSGGM